MFVQLPDVGLDVVAGASVSEIESTKSVSDVYVPVTRRGRGRQRRARRAARARQPGPVRRGLDVRDHDVGCLARSMRCSTRPRTARSSTRADASLDVHPQVEVESALWASGPGSLTRVLCARCGHQNPADARFCSSCGAPLDRLGQRGDHAHAVGRRSGRRRGRARALPRRAPAGGRRCSSCATAPTPARRTGSTSP